MSRIKSNGQPLQLDYVPLNVMCVALPLLPPSAPTPRGSLYSNTNVASIKSFQYKLQVQFRPADCTYLTPPNVPYLARNLHQPLLSHFLSHTATQTASTVRISPNIFRKLPHNNGVEYFVNRLGTGTAPLYSALPLFHQLFTPTLHRCTSPSSRAAVPRRCGESFHDAMINKRYARRNASPPRMAASSATAFEYPYVGWVLKAGTMKSVAGVRGLGWVIEKCLSTPPPPISRGHSRCASLPLHRCAQVPEGIALMMAWRANDAGGGGGTKETARRQHRHGAGGPEAYRELAIGSGGGSFGKGGTKLTTKSRFENIIKCTGFRTFVFISKYVLYGFGQTDLNTWCTLKFV